MPGTDVNNATPDNTEPEYYTLQGIKLSVNHLTPGIYIRRQGTKVTKILVK
jgi:hypothetical protein